jgi:hypothetical protein
MTMFVTERAVAYIASFLGYRKARRKQKHSAENEVRKILRLAHTDYRLAHEEVTGKWLLCYGGCITLDRTDVDFEFFDTECGRTGITTATVYSNGAITFHEENVPSDEDEYVFAEGHQVSPFPIQHSSASVRSSIIIEMV